MSNSTSGNRSDNAANPAADLIREKLNKLYTDEPNAQEELSEAEYDKHPSKHQQFMLNLSKSGRSLADIQTAWHSYYQALPDAEKHEVWQEFYNDYSTQQTATKPQVHPMAHAPEPTPESAPKHQTSTRRRTSKKVGGSSADVDSRTVSDVKKQILSTTSNRSKAKRNSHLKSLAFGLASGLIVVVILLFSFFNERFLAPFVTPSRTVSNDSIIIDPSATVAGSEPMIIIPKINVEIPVVYDEPSIDETAIHNALDRGVVHYATTSLPGEQGNGAIFGHSSNNIFNKGRYKFAFVLLNRLESGDTFVLQKDGKRYVYRVFDKKVVKPSEVGVLNANYGKPATFSLITCDPPGTSLNRLVITGEQITPDPAQNTASSVKTSGSAPATLPSNSETLWHRLTSWL